MAPSENSETPLLHRPLENDSLGGAALKQFLDLKIVRLTCDWGALILFYVLEPPTCEFWVAAFWAFTVGLISMGMTHLRHSFDPNVASPKGSAPSRKKRLLALTPRPTADIQ